MKNTESCNGEKRRVCIVTSTRADWGLLRPLAEALRQRPDVELSIVATNMHLLERYGMTVNELIADGFYPDVRVPLNDNGDDSELARTAIMAQCLKGMGEAFAALHPDLVVLLGDRYEILATACAASVMCIPIVHIAGGEVTLGAVDDRMRHAITKLSALHLTATEDYRQRVIRMGESPDRVINTGAIGVWNVMNIKPMPLDELCESLGGFRIPPGKTLLVTFHPATLDSADPTARCQELLSALDSFPEYKIVITYPNNDARSVGIINLIERYGKEHPGRVLVVKSLGARRYMSILPHVAAVVGNSSSAIVEVPSTGTPSVDIGVRQKGRISAPSVIHCADDAASIRDAIEKALSPQMQALAARRDNPYYKDKTLNTMVDAVVCTPLSKLRSTQFYDA